MNIQRMHHEVKLRLNKINSNHKLDLPPAFIDDFINDAQFRYIEIFYSGNNSKQLPIGFEVTQQRIDMLSSLVVPFESHLIEFETDFGNNKVYKFNLKDTTKPYSHFVRGNIFTACPDMSYAKMELNMIRHQELDDVLVDENRKPSLKWRRAICTEASDINGDNCLFIHTNNEYVPINLNLSYIKNPKKVFYGGYDSLEFLTGDINAYNTATTPVNCEIAERYHSIVIDIAIELITRSLEDINQNKLTQDLILKTT